MSRPLKSNGKSKFVNEQPKDEISPLSKRRKNNSNDNATMNDDLDGYSKLFQQYATTSKSGKTKNSKFEESHQKVLNVFDEQKIAHRKCNDKLLQNLSALLVQLDGDLAVMTENEVKLQKPIVSQKMCLRQGIIAYEQRIEDLKNVLSAFKSDWEESETKQQSEIDKVSEELADDIKKLEQELVADARRSSYEELCKTVNALGNEY